MHACNSTKHGPTTRQMSNEERAKDFLHLVLIFYPIYLSFLQNHRKDQNFIYFIYFRYIYFRTKCFYDTTEFVQKQILFPHRKFIPRVLTFFIIHGHEKRGPEQSITFSPILSQGYPASHQKQCSKDILSMFLGTYETISLGMEVVWITGMHACMWCEQQGQYP